MHVFQPFKIEDIDLNPYTAIGDAGICITAEIDGKINTKASSNVAFGKLWNKDVIFVFVRDTSYTKEILDKSDFFSVTFFEDSFKSSLNYLKKVSGRIENKIEQIGMHINHKIDIPYIDEGHLVFLCDKLASLPINNTQEDSYISKRILNQKYSEGNFHHMYVGEILETLAR